MLAFITKHSYIKNDRRIVKKKNGKLVCIVDFFGHLSLVLFVFLEILLCL